ncbi:MAG: serine/threonine-protein kinase [Bradymonadia bacterium]
MTIPCPSCETPSPPEITKCAVCGFERATDVSPFEVDTVLEGRYRIDQEAGRGGMGVVYRGTDLTLSRPVAIKAMLSGATDAGVLARFMHEARALASVEHPSLVPVYAVGQEQGVYYMIMRFIEGRPLSQVIEEEAPLPEDFVVRLVRSICDALGTLHAAGLVHRDVKPANMIVGDDETVTLMDLGIVKTAADSTEWATAATGTPKYMPPEIISEETIDGRADLYALGVVAYQCLTGQVPFDGPTPMSILYQQAHTPPTPIRSVNDAVSKGLAQVVHKLLEKSPGDRFDSATELRQALLEPQHKQVDTQPTSARLFIGLIIITVGLFVFLRPQNDNTKPEVNVAETTVSNAPVRQAQAKDRGAANDVKIKPDATVTIQKRQREETPKPAAKDYTITSRPRGAIVRKKGKRVGRTPFRLKRAFGSAPETYSISKANFKSRSITIRFDEQTEYRIKLKPAFKLLTE